MNWRFGYYFVLSLPIGAAMAHADNVRIAGFNYTGFLWLAFLAAGIVVLLADPETEGAAVVPFPVLPWFAWFGWLWLSATWCESDRTRSIQDAVQISMPFLMAILGSMFVRTPAELERLMRVFRWTVPLLCGWVILRQFAQFTSEEAQGQRVLALNAVLVGCVFLGGYPRKVLLPVAGWIACVALGVLTGSRMAALALLGMPVFHPIYPRVWIRPAGIAAICGTAFVLFYTPMMQERIFHSGSGTLADLGSSDMSTSGRFETWPYIWEQAQQHPWAGAGVGSTHHFVPQVWAEMYHCHNDYLRVYFETGMIGLVLFTWACGSQVWQLWRGTRRQPDVIRDAFAASLLGFVAFLVTSITDNTLVYNVWYMNPLFALMGAAYGARAGVGVPARPPKVTLPLPVGAPFAHRFPTTGRFDRGPGS